MLKKCYIHILCVMGRFLCNMSVLTIRVIVVKSPLMRLSITNKFIYMTKFSLCILKFNINRLSVCIATE